MDNYFDELVRKLAQYQVAVDAAYLHGLLTGCATIPAMDSDSLITAIAGEQPLAESVIEAVLDSIEAIADDLAAQEFQARFDIHQDVDGRRWLDGYLKAVEIHEQDWQEINESHIRAAALLMMLHTMADEKLQRDLTMQMPGPKDLKTDSQLVTDLVCGIYEEFHGDSDGPSLYDGLSSLLHIPDAELAAMDEVSLMAVVTSCNDVLPFNVVTECVSRNDAMLPLLREHLENDIYWSDEVDESDWWGLLHAIFILGLISGEASAQSLLDAFRRVTLDDDNDLTDWLSGYWPALCRNKTEFTAIPLRQIAEDRSLRWHARCEAIDCVLAAAAEQGRSALEQSIDWLAAMCGDATEDPKFRVIAGHSLLSLPRERHRPVMEELVDLVDLQRPESVYYNAYTRDEIQHSFDSGDSPQWDRFEDPWQFYNPDDIQRRAERWGTEDCDLEADSYDPIEYGFTTPFLREEPKVGRNDPCPCGSGKKYKKCCLRA